MQLAAKTLRENEEALLVSWSHTAGCFNHNRASERQKKQTRSGAGRPNAAIIECWKQHGAVYDPLRKKWVVEITSELNLTFIGDSIRRCISRRTGIPPSKVPIPEETIYP
jgi:hypothetical protein